MPLPQAASPAYRIKQGETILALVWSNAAVNMDAFFGIIYDDGTEDTFRLDRFVTGSLRAAQLLSTSQTARSNGFVTDGLVFADGAQRGQTYVVVYCSKGYNSGDVRAAIAKGYVYASTPLAVGQQVEPGPAGGHGMLKVLDTTDPAAGSDYTTQIVPAGAIWRPRDFKGQLVTDATAGNRTLSISYQSATLDYGGGVSDPIPPSSTSSIRGGIGTGHTTTPLTAGMAGGLGLPDTFLIAADLVVFITKNLAAADNWGQGALQVEEWVMPN
jgi:hypothetical protein